ncbi:MAG: branched-chain amino acid ABC transporter substrate-binding protein [Acetobacteraceae bacterium]|nr:branched-chain amino acid ABC transporter substrate-binding protein [Acetobacteraceae bacterium]
MTSLFRRLAAGILMLGLLFGAGAVVAQGTIKVAFIAPFSGPTAAQGDAWLKMLNYAMEKTNARGGALGKKFEIVTFDDKFNPAEALIALKAATDQNISIIVGGVGSNVAGAMVDGVAKHNARNPNNRAVYLNVSALTTEFTEEKCDFWHFRFSANVTMRVATMIRGMPQDVKTVYLMNQDYAYGQGVYADTKKFIAEFRPDVKIVGEEMIPLMKIKDFSAYVPKIKASGAQALLTSNWGADFNLLMKAAVDGGLDMKFYTFSAHLNGGQRAMGEAGLNRVIAVLEGHNNLGVETGNAAAEEWVKGWRATGADFDFPWVNFQLTWDMLAAAVNKAGSSDALKIALALEGLEKPDMYGKSNVMRKADHQLIQPFYTALFTKPVKYDSEGTGLGWKTLTSATAEQLTFPTECKMKRPSGA